MGQKHSYPKEIESEKFLIIQNFLTASEKHFLMKSVNKLMEHKWCFLTKTANNSTVLNKKRKQAILFLHKYKIAENINKNIAYEIGKWLAYCSDTIGPVIEPILDRFLMNCVGLKRDTYYIQRVMYMDIPPNEPEQQVHQDGDEGDGTYYIFLPLNYWSHDMGATVYYKDSIVGKIRDIGYDPERKEGYYQLPNKGFLKDNKYKDLYDKARVRKELKLGDLSCHASVALHHGAKNNSEKTRKGLFIIIQTWDEDADERSEWVDGLDMDIEHNVPLIREAQKNVYSRKQSPPEGFPDANNQPAANRDNFPKENPFNKLPPVNYKHNELFKKKPLPLLGEVMDNPNIR